jgi:stage IV sporulation protein B
MKNKFQRWLALVLATALLVCGGAITANAAAGKMRQETAVREVYVGGMPFGVKFFTEGVMVVGFCDIDTPDGENHASGLNPAREAGVCVKDIILKIDGAPIGSADDMTAVVEHSAGRPLTFTVRRVTGHDKSMGSSITTELDVTVTPIMSRAEARYKTGVWVRDSGAGIGTVTYIDPETHAFGGLGHGICDGDTGELIPMKRGQVSNVNISGIERGQVGHPGAVKGYFVPGKTGTLIDNTACGVFGVFTEIPSTATTKLEIAPRGEVKTGRATILCTLDDGKMGAYTATIGSIDRDATGSKCFAVTVTDTRLLEKTGGIVQGMSGSPIIQNGKLVGAVTHVLVGDPTTGYGIFIDNMMRDMSEALK